MNPHTPSTPLPFFAAVHAWQVPAHPLSQQTPSIQNPLPQSAAVKQACAFGGGKSDTLFLECAPFSETALPSADSSLPLGNPPTPAALSSFPIVDGEPQPAIIMAIAKPNAIRRPHHRVINCFIACSMSTIASVRCAQSDHRRDCNPSISFRSPPSMMLECSVCLHEKAISWDDC
jgi:hypothetical protein